MELSRRDLHIQDAQRESFARFPAQIAKLDRLKELANQSAEARATDAQELLLSRLSDLRTSLTQLVVFGKDLSAQDIADNLQAWEKDFKEVEAMCKTQEE